MFQHTVHLNLYYIDYLLMSTLTEIMNTNTNGNSDPKSHNKIIRQWVIFNNFHKNG